MTATLPVPQFLSIPPLFTLHSTSSLLLSSPIAWTALKMRRLRERDENTYSSNPSRALPSMDCNEPCRPSNQSRRSVTRSHFPVCRTDTRLAWYFCFLIDSSRDCSFDSIKPVGKQKVKPMHGPGCIVRPHILFPNLGPSCMRSDNRSIYDVQKYSTPYRLHSSVIHICTRWMQHCKPEHHILNLPYWLLLS
ncbi:hypothetical protein BO86DRAFT_118905 [Aspergillus japonicus CBS 114.51]|uniref:Uncharacterized protein n=1 Tax=Aspergillus japonicus CBS 114.51 TaxID=1448312 RepID=A0A8T8WYP2_ASPJA|nr:hypothetical protein BO86DRAFT_118905 [Aspergillus japonicus CBS 114.51]RAH80973.1 hypothetical protein BO86DRAFT_118905 [Aspergillus japonicus CBS 114.51]